MTQPSNPAAEIQVSVVIPVCNEEDNVLPLAREIHAALAGRYALLNVTLGLADCSSPAPAAP